MVLLEWMKEFSYRFEMLNFNDFNLIIIIKVENHMILKLCDKKIFIRFRTMVPTASNGQPQPVMGVAFKPRHQLPTDVPLYGQRLPTRRPQYLTPRPCFQPP